MFKWSIWARRRPLYVSFFLAGGVFLLMLLFSRHSDRGTQRQYHADTKERILERSEKPEFISPNTFDILSKSNKSLKKEDPSVENAGERVKEEMNSEKRWRKSKQTERTKEFEETEEEKTVDKLLERKNKIRDDLSEWEVEQRGEIEDSGRKKEIKIIQNKEEIGGEKLDEDLITGNEKKKLSLINAENSDYFISHLKKVNSLHVTESSRRIKNRNKKSITNQHYNNTNNDTNTTKYSTEMKPESSNFKSKFGNGRTAVGQLSSSYQLVFKQFLNMERVRIKKTFANMKLDIAFNPGQIVPINKARRILIVSSWRSGSSFLGDILSSYPGTFYTYEPLHFRFKSEIVKGEHVSEAMQILNDTLSCNFRPSADNIEYWRLNKYILEYNTEMWNSCFSSNVLCFDPNFHNKICQYCPVSVIKTVRMGLSPMAQFLDDPALDTRVIHLVRDPRGVQHSRSHLSWCDSKACNNSKMVCQNFKTDIAYSEEFVKKYPDRFLRVRYEDLSLEPEIVTKNILKFAGLHYHDRIGKFLEGHTRLSNDSLVRENQLGTFTTFRDSKSTPFVWRDSMTFENMRYIQSLCNDSLKVLGYTLFETLENYNNKSILVLS